MQYTQQNNPLPLPVGMSANTTSLNGDGGPYAGCRVKVLAYDMLLPPQDTNTPQTSKTQGTNPKPPIYELLNSHTTINIPITENTSCNTIKRNTYYEKAEGTELKVIVQNDPWHYSLRYVEPNLNRTHKCKTCDLWNPINGYITHQTNGKKILTKVKSEYNCHTKNVIYCLECPVCNIQYVGETSQQIHSRMNGHRGNIIGKGKDDTFIARHCRSAHGLPVMPKLCILEVIRYTTQTQ